MTLRISLVHQFEQQEETWNLRFFLDGKRLVSSDGKALYLWRLDEIGNWIYEKSLPFRGAWLDFAPDDGLYVADPQCLQILSLDDGKNIATVLWDSPTHHCAFSPDRHWMVTNNTTGNVLVWDLLTYQHISLSVSSPYEGEFLGGAGGNFRFTPDGQRLVFSSTSHGGNVQICYFDPLQQELMLQKTFRHGCINMAISPDGKILAMIVPKHKMYAAYKEEIYIYDLDSLGPLQLLHVFPQTANGRYDLLAFSPDSQYLISSNSKLDGCVDILSLTSFDRTTSFAAHPGLWSDPISGLDWSKTGYIATGGASFFANDPNMKKYTIKIWKVEDEKEQHP